MTPIWQDIYVTIPSNYPLFYVHINGTQVYAGKAAFMPNEVTIKVRLNDIIADYLTYVTPNFFVTESKSFDVLNVVVRRYDGQIIWSDTIIPDWSYTNDYNPAEGLPLAPIDNRLHPRQVFVMTNYGGLLAEAEVEYDDGYLYNEDLDYGPSVVSFIAPQGEADRKTLLLVLGSGETTRYYDYTYTKGCERFVLYYINAYGGWESLLCDGTSTTSESYTRNTYKRVYDNNNALARGTVNYANEVAKTYTLRTGLLTEEGAANMHHLIGSPMVFLQDFANGGEIVPVTIDDKSVEAKTFNSNGRRPIQYTIKATLARDRVRR